MKREFGLVKDPVDERDMKWEDHVHGLQRLPQRCVKGGLGPTMDQANTSKCVAYSMHSIKMEEERRETGQLIRFDHDSLYDKCKAEDGIPNAKGTFLRVALKIVQRDGMLVHSGSGANHKIKSYLRLNNLQDIKEAIHVDGPVIFGMNVDQGIFEAGQGVLPEPRSTGSGGHAMVIAGYDDRIRFKKWRTTGGVWIKNSWGASWGRQGYAWMPYSWFETHSNFDAWKVIDTENL